MKLIFSFFTCCLLFCMNVCAQKDSELDRSLSVEIGKNGLIYNLVYDQKLKNDGFGLRIGAGSNFSKYARTYTVGAGFYYVFGKSANYFELGTDIQYLSIDGFNIDDDQRTIVLIYPNEPTNTYYLSFNFGYRYIGKKILFRAGLAPGFTSSEFIPGGYISCGVRF